MPKLGVTQQTAVVRRNVEAIARELVGGITGPGPSAPPVLVVLMGAPGSGKSHLARPLAAGLGAVVVATDELRRHLFVAPSYARAESRTVFALAHAVCRLLLAAGRAVVFDATNLREADRRPVRALATNAGVPVILVRVTAPDAVVRERLAGRLARVSPHDLSDADIRVYEAMRERFEEPAVPYLTVDSSGDLALAVERVREAVRSA